MFDKRLRNSTATMRIGTYRRFWPRCRTTSCSNGIMTRLRPGRPASPQQGRVGPPSEGYCRALSFQRVSRNQYLGRWRSRRSAASGRPDVCGHRPPLLDPDRSFLVVQGRDSVAPGRVHGFCGDGETQHACRKRRSVSGERLTTEGTHWFGVHTSQRERPDRPAWFSADDRDLAAVRDRDASRDRQAESLPPARVV